MKTKWNSGLESFPVRDGVMYFRGKPVFERLFCGFREKYASYGKFSGTVVLRQLSLEEIEDLEGFFQKNYHGKRSASISAAAFAKALKSSRFAAVEPKELLEAYFGEPLIGKREQREEREKEQRQLFLEMRELCQSPVEEEWIKEAETGGFHAYLMKRCQEEGKESLAALKEALELGVRILRELPCFKGRVEYLAVFAAMVTGNPHAFDDRTRDGQLLYLIAQWVGSCGGIAAGKNPFPAQTSSVVSQAFSETLSELFPAMRKQQVYFMAGILRDDLSNYTMVCGIRAWGRENGLHAGMEGFLQEGEMVHVPLYVLANWKRVQCPENMVYILENPSVYAMFCRKWQGKRACMCMNGQPRLSSLLLLRLLAAEGVKAYYAGDFDPEGLLIAQKLKTYYPGDFIYWHMSPQVYERSVSDQPVSEKRMRMLDRIWDPELLETAAAIRWRRAAGYQENVWELYLQTPE